jgi:hypothetical protein
MDGRALAALYESEPYLICTDLDRFVRTEIAGDNSVSSLYRLSNLQSSRAFVSGPPGAARLQDDRLVVYFTLTWEFHIRDQEPRTSLLSVLWILDPHKNPPKVIEQKTSDLSIPSGICSP